MFYNVFIYIKLKKYYNCHVLEHFDSPEAQQLGCPCLSVVHIRPCFSFNTERREERFRFVLCAVQMLYWYEMKRFIQHNIIFLLVALPEVYC